MEAKPQKPIVIKSIDDKGIVHGIAPSAQLGFADMRNLDINTVPGLILNSFNAQTWLTPTALPMWQVEDVNANATIYSLHQDGKIYSSAQNSNWKTWTQVAGNTFTVTINSPAVFSATAHGLAINDSVVFSTTGALPTGLTAGTTYFVIAAGYGANGFEVSTSVGGSAVITSGSQSGTHTFIVTTNDHGNGLQIWNNYLFKARDSALDVYGPLSNSPSWTNNWISPTLLYSDTSVHPMIVGTDSKLYGADGANTTTNFANLFSVTQNAGQTFAPGTSATYTLQFSSQSTAPLTGLPYGYRIRCLSQLGNNIMIGTFLGQSNGDVIQGGSATAIKKVADIFPWDRVSATFGLPIRLFEQGINSMVMVNNLLYISAGQFGNFYVYNGYLAQKLFEFPHNTTATLTTPYTVNTIYPAAMMYHAGRLFFGITSGTSSLGASGVYSVNLDGTQLCMDNTINGGGGNTDNTTYIGCLFPIRDYNLSYLIGWTKATGGVAYGVDLVDASNTYSTNYSSYFDTQWYDIGQTLIPGTTQTGRINVEQNLASGDGLQIYYRTDRSASFTSLFIFDFATWSAVAEKDFPMGNISSRKVQFRVAFANQPRFQSLIIDRNA